MSVSVQDQLQQALGDAYLLERELGGGGMSRVFLALERALGRKVVVKMLLPELAAGVNVERFRREIQLAAQLQHPHIVPLLSAGEAEGLPYFIMPFVSGESLRTRISRQGEFPVAETMRILRDVVSALAYAHSHGVIHRDVKPENVLLSGGVAVVTDFGVAKAVSASADGLGATSLTSLGVALGTPAYMAPEQATASPQTDHRADIYAIGVVAYEMLTGHPPFSGRPAQAVLAAHVVEDPEPVERRRPSVPPMLANLVRECLAKRPAERPQSASEVMNVLDGIATPSGGTAATTAVRIPVAGKPNFTRLRWPVLAGMGALLLLLVAGLLWRGLNLPSETSRTAVPGQTGTSLSIEDSAIPPSVPAVPPAVERAEPAPRQRTDPARRPSRDRSVPSAPLARIREPEAPTQDSLSSAVVTQPMRAGPAPAAAPQPVTPEVAAPPASPRPAPESTPSLPAKAAVATPTPVPARPLDSGAEIRAVAAQYARAIESKNLGELRRVYPGMTSPQQRGWEQFFQLVRDVKADLTVERLDIASGAASAQVTGTYTYLNTSTGRQEHQPVSFHASFKNQGGVWRMVQVR